MVLSGVARNLQWGVGGGLGGEAPAARSWDLGANSPPVLGEFCNFSRKTTLFYAYFRQNSYFKAITHQFKISLIG